MSFLNKLWEFLHQEWEVLLLVAFWVMLRLKGVVKREESGRLRLGKREVILKKVVDELQELLEKEEIEAVEESDIPKTANLTLSTKEQAKHDS